ncbi:MAG: hypothetical protein Q8M15_06425 [Bacteroidota bacterium]|nr:hypothetical protein [Bacteroidota bacterium]
MKKIIRIRLSLGAVLITVIMSCEKNNTLYIKPRPVAVTFSVSLSKDLVPIFTKSCALNGCHPSGGKAPDLSADNAYNSLINGKFIDKAAPESSIVYKRLTGSLTPAMPMGAPANPSNIEGLILAWIKQGAKKN